MFNRMSFPPQLYVRQEKNTFMEPDPGIHNQDPDPLLGVCKDFDLELLIRPRNFLARKYNGVYSLFYLGMLLKGLSHQIL